MQSPRKRKASSSSSLSSSAAEAGGKVVVLGWNSPINQRRRPDVIRFRAYGNIFLIIWTSVIFLHHFEIRQDFYLWSPSLLVTLPKIISSYRAFMSFHHPFKRTRLVCACVCVDLSTCVCVYSCFLLSGHPTTGDCNLITVQTLWFRARGNV